MPGNTRGLQADNCMRQGPYVVNADAQGGFLHKAGVLKNELQADKEAACLGRTASVSCRVLSCAALLPAFGQQAFSHLLAKGVGLQHAFMAGTPLHLYRISRHFALHAA